ncbi:MAG: glucosaminidase domain-containing protein [Pseudomonadota bacterium]|uniref:glycoside hydrolase family 73 protein n=1 Tax=Ralstonia pickettii TaxID=329 RepID=UPI002714A4C4|nr:glucosaminidase domain-containing protein [Ralstonia pickettii]MEE2977538.1 glucosaminidase domain-containing protein [Pseudomonadota bacterium]WKZ84164.1 glucosaminidase domain-containing protein [Ralstonia pickettii]
MATIVDALIVTLGLDSAAFKRGKSEASQATKKLTAEETRAAKEIEERNKRAADSFKRVRSEVLALVAIFTAGLGIKGLADFAGDTIKSAIATGQLARELGMVPGEVRAVEQSFDRLGASVGDADEALKGIQEQAAKLKTGELDKRLEAYLLNASRAGVNADVSDANNPIKKLERDAEIAQKLAQTQGTGFAILAMQQEGYTRAMAYALMQGPQALRAEMERQQKLNELSEQETDRLRALNNRWKDFKEGISNNAQRVVIAMAPAFETIMGLLERLSKWFSAHADQIGTQVGQMAEQFAAWVNSIDWKQVIADVKSFFEQLDKGVQALGGWKVVLMALIGLKILSIVSPVLQLAGALGGVGSSLGLIGRLGPAAIAVLLGLTAAKALGLPDTDQAKGIEDIKKGDWLAASADLPAGEFLKAVAAKASAMMTGKSNEDVAAFMSLPDTLVKKAGPDAVNAAVATQQKYGVPAAVTLGQYGLESSFGKRMPAGSNNPFGIKATAGQPYVEAETTEVINGVAQRVKQRFAKYDSLADAFDAHGKLLATGKAYAEARKHSDDPMAYADALTGKYATDPQYGAKLRAMIGQNSEALRQANAAQIAQQTAMAPAAAAPVLPAPTSTSSSETNINGPINVYTQATDAAGIARDFVPEVQRQTMVTQANTGLS